MVSALITALTLAGMLILSAGSVHAGDAARSGSSAADRQDGAKATIARSIASGEPLEGIIKRMVKDGMPVNEVVNGAIRAGADPAKTVYASISAGHSARLVVESALRAGASLDPVINAALRAGGERGDVQKGAKGAGVNSSDIANAFVRADPGRPAHRDDDRDHQRLARGDRDRRIEIPSHPLDIGGGGGAPPCTEPASPYKPHEGHGRWDDHFVGRGHHYGWDNDHGNDGHHGRNDRGNDDHNKHRSITLR